MKIYCKPKSIFAAGCIALTALIFCSTSASAAPLVSIKKIESRSLKDHTDVIIHLSGSVEYTVNHLTNPERIYFDLKNTTLPKKVKSSFTVSDRILKAVRSRQFTKSVVRIVLDLENAGDFKAAIVNGKQPRLVIDIHMPRPVEKKAAKPQVMEIPEIRPDNSTAAIPVLPVKETIAQPQEKTPPLKQIISQRESDASQPSPTQPEAVKSDAASLIESGEKNYESGNYETSLADFRKAAELNPRNSEIYLSIGRALLKINRTDEALASYKKALEYNPNSADAYNGLGYTYYKLARSGSAIEAFESAIKINPDHDDAHAGLGYTYLTMGDINSAMEHYKILQALGSPKADELLRLILKATGGEPGTVPAIKPLTP